MTSAATEKKGSTASRVLTLTLGKELYALSVMNVREIIRPLEISPVPRSPAEFSGEVIAPPGMTETAQRAGHVPGAQSIPWAQAANEDGTFKGPEEIHRLFVEAGMDPQQPFVASCGSGVTANSLIFAAHLLGNDSARLYDGSWSEWGADPATPKALGPA